MISDDDTNIDLFPQTINRQNFVRLTGIDSGAPSYAIITGNAGDKWGLYGGTENKNDFLNVYRSLGNDAAVKLGAKFGRHSLEKSDDEKEAAVAKGNSKNSYIDLELDATYGANMGDRETAVKVLFAYGPNSIAAVPIKSGTYEDSRTNGTTTTKRDGEANDFMLKAAAFVRQPMQVAMFTKVLASASFSYLSHSSTLTSNNTKVVDKTGSTLSLAGSALLFDEKKIADNTRVFYGLGANALIEKMSNESKLTGGGKTKNTTFRITGPAIKLGLESDINYGKLRFGISRSIDVFNYDSTDETKEKTPPGDVNNDTAESTTFDFIGNGAYQFAAGYGVEYKHLQVDITLMNDIWVKGPQKLFSSAAGPLGAEASVIYTY